MASILMKEKIGYGSIQEEEDQWAFSVPSQKGEESGYARLYRDPVVLLQVEPIDQIPLEEREIEYLQAVQPTSVRVKEYLNEVDKKMKMDLIVGDKVIFKLNDGIVFGIEIQDQAYRGKGTSNGRPHFTCRPNNAVFVAMDKIIKKQDPPCTTMYGGLKPTIRSQTKPTAASGQPKSVKDRVKDLVKETIFSIEDNTEEKGVRFEAGDVSGHKSRFKEGDRVILQTVKEDIVAGTVRWVGPIRISKDMKIDPLPIVGIETVRQKIDPSKDFDGVNIEVTGNHGTKLFKVPYNHTRVFLPEQLVLFVKEYTMQKQKDHDAKFQQGQKESKQDEKRNI
uniref:CAP-Gly domain-containing protein n=1 Tax=Amphimedon queenslandica TaxID=400682 RepID=A0A1X7VM93_AMPQE